MPNRVIENQMFWSSGTLTNEDVIPNLVGADLAYPYLSADEDLDELIEADADTLRRLDITHDELACEIEELFASPDINKYRNTLIFPQEYIHSPQCPWGDFIAIAPFTMTPTITEILVVNRDKLEEFNEFAEQNEKIDLKILGELVKRDLIMPFSDLHPHLIRQHKFCQGKQSAYRVDPERAVHYLGITK